MDSEQYGGPKPFSEPQTMALLELVMLHKPKSFINVHSGEWAIYVPWDSKDAYSSGMPVRVHVGFRHASAC